MIFFYFCFASQHKYPSIAADCLIYHTQRQLQFPGFQLCDQLFYVSFFVNHSKIIQYQLSFNWIRHFDRKRMPNKPVI